MDIGRPTCDFGFDQETRIKESRPMRVSIPYFPRGARRRLERVVRKEKDPAMVRRAATLLLVFRFGNVTEVAQMVAAARSSVYRWIGWFEFEDVDGIRSLPRGRPMTTVTDEVLELIDTLVRSSPRNHGYLRTRWSSELLAKEIHAQLGNGIHASTVRRLLPLLGFRYRRARPFLYRSDPNKAEKLARIRENLERREPRTAVFFVDEADVNLNPKIGFGWRPVGAQEQVPTPGQNQKRYLAGALNAHTGKVVWVDSPKKNSELFIDLLREVRRTYRWAKRIVLVLDNVNTHRSHKTSAFLRRNPKFNLVFQPVYHPWVNDIERLWKTLHDTITRNHRCGSMDELMEAVVRFMEVVQPFPGSEHGLASLAA
jgi:transposase